MRKLVVVLFALAMALPATAALAQDGQVRVIELPRTVITGRPQRPVELVLVRGEGGRYEVTELRTSFVRNVVRSVSRRPF